MPPLPSRTEGGDTEGAGVLYSQLFLSGYNQVNAWFIFNACISLMQCMSKSYQPMTKGHATPKAETLLPRPR